MNQADKSPFRDLPKEELAAQVGKEAQPGSEEHYRILATLIARCTFDLEKSLNKLESSQNKNSESSDKLSRRVFWLNAVLAVATVVYAVVSVLTFLHSP